MQCSFGSAPLMPYPAIPSPCAACRLRHRQLLEECAAALLRYEGAWQEVDIAAEELRAAARALGKLTGAIDTEEVLDSIFSEFCIGK